MSIPKLSAAEFRQLLAGLTDPAHRQADKIDKLDVKHHCISLVSILPLVYSEDLDRKAIWERIGQGIVAAVPKSDSDLMQYVNCCLEYVKADPGKVAACEPLSRLIATMQTRPVEWKSEFLRYMHKNHYVVLVHARQKWNESKTGEVML